MTPDEIDAEDAAARAAAAKHDWIRQVTDRRWRDPMSLRGRAIRALNALRERDLPPPSWGRRHAVIVDALSAHALAAHGREHWLTRVFPPKT